MAKKKPVAGRGKKTCPKCKAIVGVRTAKCPTPECKYEFPIKSKGEKKPLATDQSSLRDSLLAEKKRIEDVLQNKNKMEQRLKAIEQLLKTMDE